MDTTKQNRLVGKSYAHLARTPVNYSVAEATFQNEWSLLDGDGGIDAYYQYLTVLHLNFPCRLPLFCWKYLCAYSQRK